MKRINPTIRPIWTKEQVRDLKLFLNSARCAQVSNVYHSLSNWRTLKCPHCKTLNWNLKIYDNLTSTIAVMHCVNCNKEFCQICRQEMKREYLRNLPILVTYPLSQALVMLGIP